LKFIVFDYANHIFNISEKELLENEKEIFERIYNQAQTKEFNKNRSKNSLLKLFIENKDLIEFNGNTEILLENILSNDKKEFHIDVYGNVSSDRLKMYDKKLYEKTYSDNISYDTDNKMVFIPKQILTRFWRIRYFVSLKRYFISSNIFHSMK
jgi:hypothetical protein